MRVRGRERGEGTLHTQHPLETERERRVQRRVYTLEAERERGKRERSEVRGKGSKRVKKRKRHTPPIEAMREQEG